MTIPAHFLENVEIDCVLIEDTGWDGAQIGFARSGCSFHDNVVRRVGSEGVEYQQQGLPIGACSSCEVRRNVLSDGRVMGIIVLDSGDSLFADNAIARFGGGGIGGAGQPRGIGPRWASRPISTDQDARCRPRQARTSTTTTS